MAARAHCKYAVPGMDAVEVHSHLAYATRDGVTQRYDLYGAAAWRGREVVLLVHGGPIPDDLQTTPVDWGLFQSLARFGGVRHCRSDVQSPLLFAGLGAYSDE